MKIVSTHHMRRIEAEADSQGYTYEQMMDNAGHAAATLVTNMLQHIPTANITILVGKGNNGGDGLVAARYLMTLMPQSLIRIYLLTKRENDPLLEPLQRAEMFIATATEDKDKRVLRNLIVSSDFVIDALFGIGIRLPITGKAADVLRIIKSLIKRLPDNDQHHVIQPTLPSKKQHTDHPHILAIDCPSGLDCDTGEIDQNTVPADSTITFIAVKPGLLTFPGAGSVGELYISQIGVAPELSSMQEPTPVLATGEMVAQHLPDRVLDSNKGSFGKTLILAGSKNYVGAAGLAAEAAYRAGVGLVTVATPQNVINALSAIQPETTWISLDNIDHSTDQIPIEDLGFELTNYDGILIGPGLGQAPETEERFMKTIKNLKHLKLEDTKLVIDADGLNLLAKHEKWWHLLPPKTIITPHPGELARLSRLDTRRIQSDRIEIAQECAKNWEVIVVLKGAHTVIAEPDGSTVVLPYKNDALATAGTGDILAGIITGFRTQGLDAFKAATTGAYVHGLAGELTLSTSSSRSVIARDVLHKIPQALKRLEQIRTTSYQFG